jgi:hypothetical protein
VPSMGKLAVLVLVLALGGLAARFIQRGRAVASLLVIGLVVPMLAPVANAQTVSVPNTLTNGSLADAEAMNENFEALRTGVNLVSPPAEAPLELTQFTNGTPANAEDVNANFAALAAVVSDAQALIEQQCVAVGGTWDAVTSICVTPAVYDCWVGGFCSESANSYPSSSHGYTNAYEGHSPSQGPPPGACDISSPEIERWFAGSCCADPTGLAPMSIDCLTHLGVTGFSSYCGPFSSNDDLDFGLPYLIYSMCHAVPSGNGPPAP